MYKLIAVYPTPADPEHFRRYYETVHAPLTMTVPGISAYRYTLEPQGMGGPSPYFCVAEVEFADQAAFEAALASENGQKTVADVPNFASGGVHIVHYEPKVG